MKRFLGFVKKEFFHIFRDYRTLLILFGMPAVQLLLFGYVITNEITNARIAVYDLSKDHGNTTDHRKDHFVRVISSWTETFFLFTDRDCFQTGRYQNGYRFRT